MSAVFLVSGLLCAVAVIALVSAVRRRQRTTPVLQRQMWLEQQFRADSLQVDDAVARSPAMQAAEELRRRFSRLQHVESSRLERFAVRLTDADLFLFPLEWLALQLMAGALLGLALSLLLGSFLGLPVGIAIAAGGAEGLLRRRREQRRCRFDEQLGDMLEMLSSALRGGFGLDQAIQAVADDVLDPMQSELRRYLQEVSLGLTGDAALGNMVRRNPSVDLRIAVDAVRVQRQLGGNLPQLLSKIAETIRSRVEIQAEIRASTAQARISGYVIEFLPVALCLLLSIINPEYFSPMIHTGPGIALLVASAVSMLLGAFLIRRISHIRI